MRTKFLSLLLFGTMIFSLTMTESRTVATEAAGVGTQHFFISSVSQQPNIVLSATSNVSNVEIPPANSLVLDTRPLVVPSTNNVNFAAGNWTGHITLIGASYTGPVTLDIGKYYSGSGPEYYGSTTTSNFEPEGFDFSISASGIQLIPNEYLLFKISGTTGPLIMKVGGANSYFTSPSASDWYPDANPPNLYTITTNAVNGTVEGSPRQTTGGYPEGTIVTLYATPNSGFTFSYWSGGAAGTENPTNVIMNDDKTITANFIQNIPLSITTASLPTGEIGLAYAADLEANGGSGGYLWTIASGALPSWAELDAFTGIISGTPDVAGTSNFDVKVTDSSGGSCVKAFSITIREETVNIYELTISISPSNYSGSVDTFPLPIDRGYIENTQVSLEAIPADGYYFDHWEGPVDEPGSASTTITINGNKSIAAHFQLSPVTHFIVSELSTTYRVGEEASFRITAKNASDITAINYAGTVTFTSSDPEAILPVDVLLINGTGTFTAIFGTIGSQTLMVADKNNASIHGFQNVNVVKSTPNLPNFSLTVIKVGNGTISPEAGVQSYTDGTVVMLSANPDPGWSFAGWSGALTSSNSNESIVIDADKTIMASFTQDEYTLTIDVIPFNGGSVVKSSNLPTYHYGDAVTLTANAGSNYIFSTWSGDVVGSVNPINIILDTNKSIIATFTKVEGGEGSGGGSGSSVNLLGKIYASGLFSRIAAEIDGKGIVQAAACFTTGDGKVSLKIPEKTKLLNKNGDALSIMTIENELMSPDAPDDWVPIMVYSLGPEGAYFNPALKLGMNYSLEKLSGDLVEKDLRLACWEENQWRILKSEIDFQNKIVWAEVTHFSSYALMGKTSLIEVSDSSPSMARTLEESPTLTAVVVTPPTVEATSAGTLAAMVGPEKAQSPQAGKAISGFEKPTPLEDWVVLLMIAVAVIATIVGIIIAIRVRYSGKERRE